MFIAIHSSAACFVILLGIDCPSSCTAGPCWWGRPPWRWGQARRWRRCASSRGWGAGQGGMTRPATPQNRPAMGGDGMQGCRPSPGGGMTRPAMPQNRPNPGGTTRPNLPGNATRPSPMPGQGGNRPGGGGGGGGIGGGNRPGVGGPGPGLGGGNRPGLGGGGTGGGNRPGIGGPGASNT